jgi:hypothetical protein
VKSPRHVSIAKAAMLRRDLPDSANAWFCCRWSIP